MSRKTMVRVAVRVLPGLLAVLLAALMAGAALAGGVVVSLEGEVTGAQAGTPFDISFSIRSAHDGSMQSGFTPSVQFYRPDTGETVEAKAAPGTEAGYYTANVTLPSAGQWQFKIKPDPYWDQSFEMTPIQVGAAGGAPAGAGGPGVWLRAMPPAGWLAVVALLAVAALAVVRIRRGTAVRA